MIRRLAWRHRHAVLGSLTYAMMLSANALVLGQLPRPVREQVLQIASTNQERLESSHLATLGTSAFFVSSPPAGYLLFVAGVLVAAGVVLGAARLAWVFALGHVGVTLVVWGLLEADLVPGVDAQAVRSVIDVGPSYGLVTVVAAALVLVGGRRRWRLVPAVALLAGLVAVDAAGPTVAGTGHVLAAALGLAVGSALVRRQHRTRVGLPRATSDEVPAW